MCRRGHGAPAYYSVDLDSRILKYILITVAIKISNFTISNFLRNTCQMLPANGARDGGSTRTSVAPPSSGRLLESAQIVRKLLVESHQQVVVDRPPRRSASSTAARLMDIFSPPTDSTREDPAPPPPLPIVPGVTLLTVLWNVISSLRSFNWAQDISFHDPGPVDVEGRVYFRSVNISSLVQQSISALNKSNSSRTHVPLRAVCSTRNFHQFRISANWLTLTAHPLAARPLPLTPIPCSVEDVDFVSEVMVFEETQALAFFRAFLAWSAETLGPVEVIAML